MSILPRVKCRSVSRKLQIPQHPGRQHRGQCPAAKAVSRSSKDLGGWFNCSCFTNRYLACLTLIRPRRSLYPTPIGAMTKLNYSLNYDLNC